jgi:uncharacterized protein (UPF0332 family)
MGEQVSYELRRLLEERKLLRIKPDRKLVTKEIKGAEYDLGRARESLEKKDFKWATIQAYFSMFHSARSLLYNEGYREKSHTALRIALKELFEASGKLSREALRNFEDAMDLREEADYRLEFSESNSVELVDDALEFLDAAKQVLRIR